MPNMRALSDQELIGISLHWRRLSLEGNVDALHEARRHETELRRRFREVDKITWGVGGDARALGEPKAASADVDGARDEFAVATADAATQSGETLRALLRHLRELLDMDIAFVAELTDGKKIFRHLDHADDSTCPVVEGMSLSSEITLCKRVVDGCAPQLMQDIGTDSRLSTLAAVKTLNIRAYLSTPVVLRDGSVYGTLCCISHKPRSALGSRQLDSLRYAAGIVAGELEKHKG